MIFPTDLFAQDALTPVSLLGAVALGVAFGFVLERSGFGRAQKLVAQFYLTDLRVFRVMFTAVVVAAVGTSLLAAVGLLDLRAVTVNYPTFLWPMIAGGLLVGAGFVISGYCPGTSVVAAASGKLDGLLTVVGVVIGAVAYAEVAAGGLRLPRQRQAGRGLPLPAPPPAAAGPGRPRRGRGRRQLHRRRPGRAARQRPARPGHRTDHLKPPTRRRRSS